MQDDSASSSLQQLYEGSLQLMHSLCSIVTAPIEYALRPFFGTRYFDPIQMAGTVMLMLLLPLFGRAAAMVPIGDPYSTGGYLGLGTLSLLFFAGSVIHAPRLWRRVVRLTLEEYSRYEGPALPFFAYLPLGTSFWVVRIVWEPLLVTVLTLALNLLTVIDRAATGYLIVCAVALAFKNYLSWYQSWLHLRNLMDARFAGPLMARALSGKAGEHELAKVHMAGFRDSAPPEVHAAAIAQLAPRMPPLPPEIAQLLSPVEPVAPTAA